MQHQLRSMTITASPTTAKNGVASASSSMHAGDTLNRLHNYCTTWADYDNSVSVHIALDHVGQVNKHTV